MTKTKNYGSKKQFIFTVVLSLVCILFAAVCVFFLRDHWSYEDKNEKILNFLNAKVKPKSVVLLEFVDSHHECLPGNAKYFLDMGYNVDVFATDRGENAFSLFPKDLNNRLTYYPYSSIDDVLKCSKKFEEKIKKYDYIFLNTTYESQHETYKKLGVDGLSNVLYQIHDTATAEWLPKHLWDQHRVIGLADYGIANFVNPHYFGNISTKSKNKTTKIFTTSTVYRDYSNLITAISNLKKEGTEVIVEVTGRYDTLSSKNIPEDLKDNFVFHNEKGEISYYDMYKIIIDCDFIFIPLDPETGKRFMTTGASGSIQLAYGFLKPLILNEKFANIYKLNSANTLLFKDESTQLESAIRNASNISAEDYNNMQLSLKKLVETIYEISLSNLKKFVI